jgi:hypothetical protein
MGGGCLLVAGTAWAMWHTAAGRSNAHPRPLIVLVTGDTGGWIVPCGCASNQSGGMPRRGTHVNKLKEHAAVVFVDAGGAPGGTSDYHRVKFESILAGELAMGVAAHNLGASEAALGADYLRSVSTKLGIPFVSANVRDADGERIAPPVRLVQVEGRRLAIVGVMSRKFAGKDCLVDEPREAALKAVEQAKREADQIIVLAYVPEEELNQLAAALPEADAVVGGPTGQSLPPRAVGPTLLASATNKGKFLIELDVPAPDARAQHVREPLPGRVVEMDRTIADEAAQLSLVQAYLAELERHNFTAAQTGFVTAAVSLPKDYRVAGTRSCAACHQQDCTAWEGSKHAHAWDTLVERGFHVDGYCQQCHTTGFGLPGGFEFARDSGQRGSGTSALRRDVGCESCHGPSLAHTLQPKTRTPFAAADQCVRCHDRDNSPNFVHATYWQTILHGAPARAPGGNADANVKGGR